MLVGHVPPKTRWTLVADVAEQLTQVAPTTFRAKPEVLVNRVTQDVRFVCEARWTIDGMSSASGVLRA